MWEPVPETFLYYAYGSNLLKKRIRINNPSAEFLGIGKLENHLLDFIRHSDTWGGCASTIVPAEGPYVWGAVWRLNNKDMPALDKQEGVEDNWYFAKSVDVVLPDGHKVQCRTYQQTTNPPLRKEEDEVPPERRPSETYLDVIVRGAIECKLPEEYNHLLDFIKYTDNWGGCSATIVPSEGPYVWGAVWRLQNKDMPALDRQEGVEDNWYFAKTVDVVLPDGHKVQCRTYQQTTNPPLRKEEDEVPPERRPSETYLDVILRGAIECKLPEEYVSRLKKISHNGKRACAAMLEKLKD